MARYGDNFCFQCMGAAGAVCGYAIAGAALTVTEGMGCFPLEAETRLSTGDARALRDLREGDVVMAATSGVAHHSKFRCMMHNEPAVACHFKRIRTEDGHCITLTAAHSLAVVDKDGATNFIKAGDVEKGMSLQVAHPLASSGNRELVPSEVTSIEDCVAMGFCAPLTAAHTILINDVVCSCSAHVSHEVGRRGTMLCRSGVVGPDTSKKLFGCFVDIGSRLRRERANQQK